MLLYSPVVAILQAHIYVSVFSNPQECVILATTRDNLYIGVSQMSVIVGKVWQEVVVHKQTVHLVALGDAPHGNDVTMTVEASQQIQ